MSFALILGGDDELRDTKKQTYSHAQGVNNTWVYGCDMGGGDMDVKLINGSDLVSALNLAKTVIHFLVYNLNRGIPMTDEDVKKINETINFLNDIIEQAKV